MNNKANTAGDHRRQQLLLPFLPVRRRQARQRLTRATPVDINIWFDLGSRSSTRNTPSASRSTAPAVADGLLIARPEVCPTTTSPRLRGECPFNQSLASRSTNRQHGRNRPPTLQGRRPFSFKFGLVLKSNQDIGCAPQPSHPILPFFDIYPTREYSLYIEDDCSAFWPSSLRKE